MLELTRAGVTGVERKVTDDNGEEQRVLTPDTIRRDYFGDGMGIRSEDVPDEPEKKRRPVSYDSLLEQFGVVQPAKESSENIVMSDKEYFEKLKEIYKNPDFLIDFAMGQNAGYTNRELEKHRANGTVPPDYLKHDFDDQSKELLMKVKTQGPKAELTPEEKDKIEDLLKSYNRNVIQFYMFITGIGSQADFLGKGNAQVISELVSGKFDKKQIKAICRLANGGWQVSQPFLGRETTHKDMQPFDELTPEVQLLDWGQVVDAALSISKILGIPTPKSKEELYAQMKV